MTVGEDEPEISDVIVRFDPETRTRIPVKKDEAVARFQSLGNHRAARIVERLPETRGVLDPGAIDALLIRVHGELQRLSEEFEHGRRTAELLRPVLAALRAIGHVGRIRIVDVGCGTGFVIRWLAARGNLGEEVELVGVDYNAALIAEASRVAKLESLRATFLVDNAFRLDEPGTVYISTGVLHHFRGDDLVELFRGQECDACQAFVHFDFRPSPLARPGAWLFHLARMREPLSIHDGVLSAVRAHSAERLLAAAASGAPSFRSAIHGAKLGPFPRVFHSVVGARPLVAEALREALGARASRLGPWA